MLAVEGVAKEQARQRAAQALGAIAADVQPGADLLADSLRDPQFPLQHDVAFGARAAKFLRTRNEVEEAARSAPWLRHRA